MKRKPFIRRLLWWLFKRWLVRQTDAGFIMRRWDGVEINVACAACGTCKNYFWIQRHEIELPHFCAYCGKGFGIIIEVDGEEMNEIQIIDRDSEV